MTKLLFALEGQDGTGKKTQLNLLERRLLEEKYAYRTIDLPQYGKLSARLAVKYLHGDFGPPTLVNPYLASTFFTLDRFEASQDVKLWLNEKKVVVANRWVASNIAHQAGKFRYRVDDWHPAWYDRNKFINWLQDLEYRVYEIPRAINIVLHMPAEISYDLKDKQRAEAGEKKDGHESDIDYLKRTEVVYWELCCCYKNYHLVECCEDGRLLSPEEIHKKIWTIMKPYLPLHYCQ